MAKIYKLRLLQNARLYATYGLVFFLLAVFGACERPLKQDPINLILEDERAIAIIIPKSLVGDTPDLSTISVKLYGGKTDQAIFGDLKINDTAIVFRPLIPLSPGLSYSIYQNNEEVGGIAVPTWGQKPKLETIYPQQDTLPENQLKLYFHFNHPMRTGQALEYIALLDSKGDTMRNVFLNLQPELWDSTGTTLTLWLDPGRIKRDLVLNRELGNPLKKSQSYQLVVSPEWKDNRGLKLGKPYIKHFVAGERDGVMPDINKWGLGMPEAGTDDPLVIKTNEPLDHYLLGESVAILNSKGKMIYSNNVSGDKDRTLKITPLPLWKAGRYQLIVKAKLEDLAGNNLNRVFDRDVRKDTQQNRAFFVREFEVK